MGALSGFRVLEFAEGVTGPVVGMLLADHGAQVVKIERPAGDYARSDPGFAVWNRGKASAAIDGSRPEDRAWLAAQVAGTDVCLFGEGDDFRSWGDEVVAAASANEALIVARFPAYLTSGRPWAAARESHGLLAAAGGLGLRQSSNDGGPVDPISKFIAYIQALWGAACVCAALYERGADGFGQEVVVTGVNGLMAALIHPYSINPALPDPPTDIGSFGRHPTYRPYRASDGRWVGSGALGAKFEIRLLELLGCDDILTDPRIGGDIDLLKHDDNLDWVMAAITQAFARRPRDEWIELIMAAGIPSGPVHPRGEALDHPQSQAIGMRIEVDDPLRGTVTMPGIPINLAGSPGGITGAAPRLGRRQDIAAWPPRPAPSRPRGFQAGPLAGVEVLNLGTYVATPYAGMLLSELGANVTKIESLSGDPFRANGYSHNRGMKSLAIDLTAADGLAAFRRLVTKADLVIDGMRPGVVKTLGIDHDSLAKEKPDIVTLSLSGFGEVGPLSQLPGFDMVMQGFAGLMLAQGDASEPVAHTVAYVDVTTASMNVFACVLGLIHHQRTGQGQHAWTSLLGSALYLQLSELTSFPARPAPRQGRPDYRGEAWFDRYYPTSDGWVRVDGSNDVARARRALAGLVARSTDDADPEALLAAAVAAMKADNAADMLNAAGIPAVRARRVTELFRDKDLMASEFTHFGQSLDGSTMALPGRYAFFSRTQRWGPMRPPGIGEHSRGILERNGLEPSHIEDLITRGIVKQGSAMPTRFASTYR